MKFEMKNYYFVDWVGMKNFEKKNRIEILKSSIIVDYHSQHVILLFTNLSLYLSSTLQAVSVSALFQTFGFSGFLFKVSVFQYIFVRSQTNCMSNRKLERHDLLKMASSKLVFCVEKNDRFFTLPNHKLRDVKLQI